MKWVLSCLPAYIKWIISANVYSEMKWEELNCTIKFILYHLHRETVIALTKHSISKKKPFHVTSSTIFLNTFPTHFSLNNFLRHSDTKCNLSVFNCNTFHCKQLCKKSIHPSVYYSVMKFTGPKSNVTDTLRIVKSITEKKRVLLCIRCVVQYEINELCKRNPITNSFQF